MDDAFDRLLTPRLVLRRFAPADAAPFAAYRSIPDVARYQSWSAPYPEERAVAFVGWLAGQHPDQPGDWFQIAIALREDPGRLIGDCGFRSRVDEPRVVDVGFTLSPAVQGHGYATEAIGELLRYLVVDRGKHKICADCDSRNDPSWRLLERLGFTREGTLRESYFDGAAWADEYLYGLLERSWRDRHDGGALVGR